MVVYFLTVSKRENAIVAMNAGGFYDPDWNSNGALPHGTVISNGNYENLGNSNASKLIEQIKKEKPLIHCITNPISINQCANAILSLGAKPIMAEHPKEVSEITETANALMLNIGNITDARMESIMLSISKAKEKDIHQKIEMKNDNSKAIKKN